MSITCGMASSPNCGSQLCLFRNNMVASRPSCSTVQIPFTCGARGRGQRAAQRAAGACLAHHHQDPHLLPLLHQESLLTTHQLGVLPLDGGRLLNVAHDHKGQDRERHCHAHAA